MKDLENLSWLRTAFSNNRKTLITAFSCFILCVVATYTDNGGFDFWATNGVWSFLPAVVVVAMIIASKNIILSLCVGLLTGAYLLSIEYLNALSAFAKMPAMLYGAMESAMSGGELASFLLRLFLVGLFIALYVQWGGFEAAAVSLLNRRTNRRNAIFARLGVLVLSVCLYFDEGARAWTLGRALRPVAEKYGVSRECLAFLSDCSSASVAAILSAWAGYEITLIQEGLSAHSSALTAEGIYAASVPFRFYPVLLLAFAFFTALFNREYLPPANTLRTQPAPSRSGIRSVLKAALPPALLAVILLSIHIFMGIGLNTAFVPAIVIASGILACLCVYQNRHDISGVFFQTIKRMRPILVPIFAILLARMLTVVTCALEADIFIADTLMFDVPAPVFPSLVFVLSAAAGFATGSAYASMALLVPLSLLSMPLSGNESLVCAAALTGGFLGAHCSPASETTLYASFGVDCPHGLRMAGQLPRVLAIGGVAVLLGYLPVGYGMPVWVAYAASITVMAAAALIFERFVPFGGLPAPSHIFSKIFPIRQ